MEQFANNANTTLNGSITSGATSITITSATGFPSSANFRIIIDAEIMLVTAGAGTTTWTVTRGQESTTAVAHNSGATVRHVITAGAISQFRKDNISSGTTASLPSAGTAGRIYYPTDGQYVYEDNGTSWLAWGPIYPMTLPPAIGSLTTINASTSSSNSTHGSINLSNTNPGTHLYEITALVQSAPATPYNFTVFLSGSGSPGTNYALMGICFRESSTGKLIEYGVYNGTNMQMVYYSDPNGSTVTTILDRSLYGMASWNGIWMRIRDDGTNLISSFSNDGYNFTTFASSARTTFLTGGPNQIGFMINPITSATFVTATCLSWLVG